jgi:hypothetical protein
MYTYGANGWDLSIIQGPFSVALCQTLRCYDSQLFRDLSQPQPARRRSFMSRSSGDPFYAVVAYRNFKPLEE